ncbi:RrF2 family transcriptional regulator [Flexibacterium corallicola]|uniref:RrF2 family transcriptional regulator n=1 Tax=Flexibacterium corallicola TaxID=3037259 RepID=UPI00286EF6EA|nr:Rrf2 family transcriptional regulator [Pseudovibrio sp. M1P-2-3]
MRPNSRLSRALHVMLHLDQNDVSQTSEQIGKVLGTNPSLVRRMMGGLRDAGIVSSLKGHGGGWCMAKPIENITLAEVYAALGSPQLFAVGNAGDTPTCPLEKSVHEAVSNALTAADSAFKAELEDTTVADLVRSSAVIERLQLSSNRYSVHKDRRSMSD